MKTEDMYLDIVKTETEIKKDGVQYYYYNSDGVCIAEEFKKKKQMLDLDRITVDEGSIFEVLDEIYVNLPEKDRDEYSKITLKFENDLKKLIDNIIKEDTSNG
tara:strand:+ start:71 stop:379 length:309 start_codon:yes stop_codon:yes gene_type:complete